MAKQLETGADDRPQTGASEVEAGIQNANENPAANSAQLSGDRSPEQQEPKNYQAIARVQGALVTDEQKLFIVTDDDGARFPVLGIRPGKLSLKLIALLPEDRKGLFSFWPQDDDGVVISSFCTPENYVQQAFGPLPNQMLLSGEIKSCHADKFVVRVKRNKGSGRGDRWFKGMSITVSSTPPHTLQPGQWIKLALQRSGGQWVLPES